MASTARHLRRPGPRPRPGRHQVAATQPTVPATSLADPPPGVDAADVLWDEIIGAGATPPGLPPGARLRLVDVDGRHVRRAAAPPGRPHRRAPQRGRHGQAPVAGLPRPRLPAAVRHGPGAGLGRRRHRRCHDTFCGTSNRADNERRYGDGSAHGPRPSGRDRFVVALAKHGLTERDIAPNDQPVQGRVRRGRRVGDAARGRSPAGAAVVLRAEMPLIVTVVAVPHRLDPRPGYTAGPVRITAWRGRRPGRRPPAHATPEARRAFENTDEEMRAAGGRSMSTPTRHAPTRRRRRPARRGRGRPVAVDAPLAAGDHLRIVDLEGNQAVDFLAYDADDPVERYSAPDTIAAQGNIFLTTGTRADVQPRAGR